MSTSKTFKFQSPQVEQIIREAYERVFGDPIKAASGIVNERIESAQRSLNFILSFWPNIGLNLWTVKYGLLGLNPNQSTYPLPLATSDVLEVYLRTSNRILGGTPLSDTGVALNAFDENSQTACTQTNPNGTIGYQWGATQYAIEMVGIQSNANTAYTLNFEYSTDGNTWVIAGAAKTQNYVKGIISWFLINIPTPANYFRIREIGGATLDIQEVCFNKPTNDTKLTRSSRENYLSTPQKNQTGSTTSYYVDRAVTPTITVWQPSINQYQYLTLFFSFIQMPEDIGAMTDSPAVPSRLLEPLVAALAYVLAFKEKQLEIIEPLGMYSQMTYKIAATEDRERVPLNIYGDYGRVR